MARRQKSAARYELWRELLITILHDVPVNGLRRSTWHVRDQENSESVPYRTLLCGVHGRNTISSPAIRFLGMIKRQSSAQPCDFQHRWRMNASREAGSLCDMSLGSGGSVAGSSALHASVASGSRSRWLRVYYHSLGPGKNTRVALIVPQRGIKFEHNCGIEIVHRKKANVHCP